MNKFQEVRFYKEENKKMGKDRNMLGNNFDFFQYIEQWEYFYIIDECFSDFYNHLFENEDTNYYDLKNYSSVYELVQDVKENCNKNITININLLESNEIKYISNNLKNKKIAFLGYLKKINLKEIYYIDYYFNKYENLNIHIKNLSKTWNNITENNFLKIKNDILESTFLNIELILEDIYNQNIFLNLIEQGFLKNDNSYFFNDNFHIEQTIFIIQFNFFINYIKTIKNKNNNTKLNTIYIISFLLLIENKKQINLNEIKDKKNSLNFKKIENSLKSYNIYITKQELKTILKEQSFLFSKEKEDLFIVINSSLLSYFSYEYLNSKNKKEKIKIINDFFNKDDFLIERYDQLLFFLFFIKEDLGNDIEFKDILKINNKIKYLSFNFFNYKAFSFIFIFHWYESENIKLHNNSNNNIFDIFKYKSNKNSKKELTDFTFLDKYLIKKEIIEFFELYNETHKIFENEKNKTNNCLENLFLKGSYQKIKETILLKKEDYVIKKIKKMFLFYAQFRGDFKEIYIDNKNNYKNNNYIRQTTSILKINDNNFINEYINKSKEEINTFNDCLEILNIINENNCKDSYFIDINMNYINEKTRKGKPKFENHISTNISKILKEKYGLRSVREEELEDQRRMDFTISNNTNANGYFIIEAKLFSNEIFNRTKKAPEKTYLKIKNNIEDQLLKYLIDENKKNGIYLIYNFSKNLLDKSDLIKKQNDFEEEKENIKIIISKINEEHNVNIVFKELFFE
jgi:hypothetical protein